MAVQRSKHFPLLALGSLSFTGSVQIPNPFPGIDINTCVTVKGTAVPSTLAVTSTLDAAKNLVTISAFESDGSGGLQAGTTAVSVDVLIFRQ